MLGPDGLPEFIVVGPAWQRGLTADEFPVAVMEACQVAAGERMAAVSQVLHDEMAHPGAERLREHLAEQAEPAPVEPLPAQWRDQVNRVQPRPLEDLVEDVLRAADDVDALAAASPLAAVGTGTDASGRIVVTVSQAIIAAVGALVAVLGAQASQMVVLHGEAIDVSAFPGGKWPNATPSQFSDATVKDGDADWSLQS
ncbi:hypothetical protein ACLQ28_30315 [Micromonospora sp. DT201]|uniref:hypothetical protein n=1 Tax=Micromonospora sp. DT201 TaxID=3393442 RepID=UPI003CED4F44